MLVARQPQTLAATARVGIHRVHGVPVITTVIGNQNVASVQMFQNVLNQEHHRGDQAIVDQIGEPPDI